MTAQAPCPYCDAPVSRGVTTCPSCEIELPEGFWAESTGRAVNPAEAFSPHSLAPGVLDIRSRSLKEPHVSLGTSEIDGAVAKESVVRTFHRHMDQLVACYKKRRGATPGLQGSITLSFMILPKGTISRVEVTQRTVPDAALEQCVLTAISRWTFPKPTNGGVARIKTVINFQEE